MTMESAKVSRDASNAVQRIALWRSLEINRITKTPSNGAKVTKLRIEIEDIIAIPQLALSEQEIT
jgi:hypothetical protein